MEVTETIKGGAVVLDSPIQVPDGTRVRVEIAESREAPGEWVKGFAGCVEETCPRMRP